MPPCASGPVFTVNRPRRNGSAWAMTGAGKPVTAAAAPAAVPANSARREILRNEPLRYEVLRDIPILPRAPVFVALIGEAWPYLTPWCHAFQHFFSGG